MKTIFIISEIKIYHGNTAGASRLLKIAKALALQDNNVFICSFQFNRRVNSDNIFKIEDNIYVIGFEGEADTPPLKAIFKRMIRMVDILKYLLNIRKIVNKTSGNNVIYLYPSFIVLMDLMVIVVFKFLGRNKIYCDVNELRRADLRNRTYSDSFLRRMRQYLYYARDYILFMLCERLTRHCDGLVVISLALKEYFVRYNHNILRIPILCDVTSRSLDVPPAYNCNDKFRLCFTGSISLKKEGFELFYEALSIVRQSFSNIELSLYGSIQSHERDLLLNKLPELYGIKANVIYKGIVAQNDLISEMQKHHLLILPRPLNMQTQYGFSTKLADYLISGVPLLATDVSDNSLYIRDNVNGFLVKAGDVNEMANKILYVIYNYNEIASSVVSRARETAETSLNYVNYSQALSEFVS